MNARPPTEVTALVEFLSGDSDRACPLCGGASSRLWVRARHFHALGEWIVFFKCGGCRSLFSEVHRNAYAGVLDVHALAGTPGSGAASPSCQRSVLAREGR